MELEKIEKLGFCSNAEETPDESSKGGEPPNAGGKQNDTAVPIRKSLRRNLLPRCGALQRRPV
ncbi:MAG: hypothetical protein LBB18_02805 [Puniceicoccales bacterium]|nr:hypothetical protein [Puniceicoccales bacterium]